MRRGWIATARFLTLCVLMTGTVQQPATAQERHEISVNELGYIDYLALAIRLGADAGKLAEQMPLDPTLNQFDARRLRKQWIEEALELSRGLPADTNQITLTVDSYLLLLRYDFDRQSYTLCLPQGIYIQKHYPTTITGYQKVPSVRMMALSTVSSCADQRSFKRINEGEENRFTFGLYLPLAMEPSAAEIVFNAAGAENAARKAHYTCRDLTLTREHNVVCGRVNATARLKDRQLELNLTTDGYGTPRVRWTLR